MIEKILVQLGFTVKEANIYSLLAEFGPQTAQQLSKASGLGRTHVYQITNILISHNLVQVNKSKILQFTITNPDCLSTILSLRQSKLVDTKQLLQSVLPDLQKSYSLHQNSIEVSYLDIVSAPQKTKTKLLTYPKSGIMIYDDTVILGHLKIQSKDIANRLRQELS